MCFKTATYVRAIRKASGDSGKQLLKAKFAPLLCLSKEGVPPRKDTPASLVPPDGGTALREPLQPRIVKLVSQKRDSDMTIL